MTTAEEKPIGSKGFYIGIDPDVDRNGVAFLDIESRMLDIQCLPFPQTLEYLQQARDYAAENHTPYKVIIEAGWMNKGNWHLNHWDGRIASAAKGVDQGRNEQTSRLLGEMCAHYGIPYEHKRPLPKCWAGKDRKITQEELQQVTGQRIKRTNQEGRDAALLAWDKAGFPMRISMASRTAKNAEEARKELKELLKNPQK